VLALLHPFAAGAAYQPAQQAPPVDSERLAIYVDCQGLTCDHDFLQTDIAFVAHVRDRHDADVHVLITAEPTAEGGVAATVSFIGQKAFVGADDVYQVVSRPAESQHHLRQRLSDAVKRGLVRYVSRTPAADDITVVHAPSGAAAAAAPDRWNRWTFATTVNGFVTGEEIVSSMSVGASVSASRVTDAWKISSSIQSQYDSSTFDIEPGRTITSVQRSHAFSSLVVRSLNDHFSLGVRASALSSRFLNQELTLRVAPAVEYNVFAYAESTRRMLTVEYSIGGSAFDYEEETIFGRTSERLLDHRLLASLRLTQPWGSVLLAGEGAHYLDDLRKRRVTAYGSIDWNLAKGLSLLTTVDVKGIRDQVFLAARGASEEEILLRQRQLATSYSYSASLGISYTFGSPYARIVNRRFAGTVGGMTTVQ
jgi:hypothetical protein